MQGMQMDGGQHGVGDGPYLSTSAGSMCMQAS